MTKEERELHRKHRIRLRARFNADNGANMEDHVLMELLLCYGLPLKDVNGIAHEVINRFGSFDRVFDASVKELQSVDGIGEYTATLLKVVLAVSKRYDTLKSELNPFVNDLENAAGRIKPFFKGVKNELVVITCLDSKRMHIHTSVVFEGSINAVNISLRKLTEAALSVNSSAVYIAHNHPTGFACPSREDITSTHIIVETFRRLEIEVLDHFVFSEDDFVSMSQDNLMNRAT